jgi:hypothetical protein
MEYRQFEYTNELGQVELQRGSLVGIALSWVIIQSLKIALLVVIAGLGFSVFKYFAPAPMTAAVTAPFARVAAYSASIIPADYRPHPHG